MKLCPKRKYNNDNESVNFCMCKLNFSFHSDSYKETCTNVVNPQKFLFAGIKYMAINSKTLLRHLAAKKIFCITKPLLFFITLYFFVHT